MSEFFQPSTDIIQRGCQNCNLSNHGKTLRKKIFLIKMFFFLFYHIRTLTETFWLSDKSSRCGGRNWVLKVHRNALRERIFIETIFFLLYQFRTISELFWPCGKLFEHGCQNCLPRVNKNTFWRNLFLNKKFCLF